MNKTVERKAATKVLKEASKELKQLAYEVNPKEFIQTEAGYSELLERIEYVKTLVVQAKLFDIDLNR